MPDQQPYTALDPALDRLNPFGHDLSNGLTNHAPMVVEALCALGRPDAIEPWLAGYASQLLPREAGRTPIGKDWRQALGKTVRAPDWYVFFQERLHLETWATVLREWLPVLAPGHCASAAHGVIRVSHAVRGLSENVSRARLHELADALALWASTCQELPVAAVDGIVPPPPGILNALSRVPLVPVGERVFNGTITSALESLKDFPPFAPVIHRVDLRGTLTERLSELTEAFARLFLTNAHDFLTAIVFVHAITGASALRPLLPYMDETSARSLLRFAWQTGAALFATFGSAAAAFGPLTAPPPDPTRVARRAIDGGDDHGIKFTEVCLREYALHPSPVFLLANARALGLLNPGF